LLIPSGAVHQQIRDLDLGLPLLAERHYVGGHLEPNAAHHVVAVVDQLEAAEVVGGVFAAPGLAGDQPSLLRRTPGSGRRWCRRATP